jgi:hypothetical protein
MTSSFLCFCCWNRCWAELVAAQTSCTLLTRVAGLFFAVDGSIVIFFPFCAPLVNSPHFYSRLPFEIAKFGIIYPMMAALQRQKLLVRILFWLYFAHMNYRSNRLALYMYDDDNHYKHSIQEYILHSRLYYIKEENLKKREWGKE